ncbi:hypothetical protein [Rubrivirga sp. IMCC43871]|uniref:hypothetical protein n=1 Tax=Rubrivirga sp. IMCC43871 TaxID=3391575 RepID=UPI00398FE86C
MPDYTPIACSVHDRLESWAVRRTTVAVVWRDGDAEHTAETTIADVFARGGADWVRLGTGAEVRADRLVTVGGVAVGPGC